MAARSGVCGVVIFSVSLLNSVAFALSKVSCRYIEAPFSSEEGRERGIAPPPANLSASHHLLRRGELGGVAPGARGRSRYVLLQLYRLARREGEGGVARTVGGDGRGAQQRLALVGDPGVGEELHPEGAIRGAVEGSPDGRLAGRALLRGGEDGEVLEVVGTRVFIAGIVGSGAYVAAGKQVYAEAGVGEDGVGQDAVARGVVSVVTHAVELAGGDHVALRGARAPDRVARRPGEEDAVVVAQGGGPVLVGSHVVALYPVARGGGAFYEHTDEVAGDDVTFPGGRAPDGVVLSAVDGDTIFVAAQVLHAPRRPKRLARAPMAHWRSERSP